MQTRSSTGRCSDLRASRPWRPWIGEESREGVMVVGLEDGEGTGLA
jgi:hypothetical protein